jgi:ADP-ribose pyrophosphatase YjhB (NUDIX family)
MIDWKSIPSPFYRVSVKAFVFDKHNRLLMGRAPDGVWEPPGGGLEHGESIEECLRRELQEELGVGLAAIGRPIVFYRGENRRGFQALKIAVETKLASHDFQFADLVEARFVTRQELLELEMSTDERGIKDCVDQIWPK